MPIEQYSACYQSPLGTFTMVSDGRSLTGLQFEHDDSTDIPSDRYINQPTRPVFIKTKRWLDTYFQRQIPDCTLPLRLVGTDFQMEVWAILRSIPYGQTTTYGQIARQIAAKHRLTKMSAQAVGGAIGRNLIPIIIPCHRVIGSNSQLTGYAGGLQLKEKLLRLEKAIV